MAKPQSSCGGCASRVVMADQDFSNVGQLRGWKLHFTSARYFEVVVGHATPSVYTLTASTTSPEDQWSHVAVTFAANTMTLKLYVNGLMVGSMVAGGFAPNRAQQFLIGAEMPLNSYWEGALDEVAIYDVVLTAAQLTQHVTMAQYADIHVGSINYGPSQLQPYTYTYNPLPTITAVIPADGPIAARLITVIGTALGAGSDITSVTLGTMAMTIHGQSTTSVTVSSAVAPLVEGYMNVTVDSTSFGQSMLSNGYFHWQLASFGTSDANPRVTELESTVISVWFNVSTLFHAPTTLTMPLGLSGDNCSLLSVTPHSLSLTSGTWNTAQLITISAAHDDIATVNLTCSVLFGPSVSDQAQFMDVSSVLTVTLGNIDTVGIVTGEHFGVTKFSSGYVIVEAALGWIGISLNSQPTATVTVTVSTDRTALATTNTTMLTFTPNLWNISQAVFVTAPQDDIVDGLQWLTLSLVCTSSDRFYNGVSRGIQVLRVDIDGQEAILASPPLRNVTEAAEPIPIYVVLFKMITSNVSVTASNSLGNMISVSPGHLNVQPSDLYQPLAFAISSTRNYVAEGHKPFDIVFGATGGDVVQELRVPLHNLDADVALFNFSRTSVTVNETGSVDLFRVGITSIPAQPIVFNLTLSDAVACASLSVSVITIAPIDWRTSALVTITGLRNPDHNATNQYCSVIASFVSGDEVYRTATNTLAVVNVDIHWPRAYELSPILMPVAGRSLTVRAYDALPGIRIFAADVSCTSVALFSNYTVTCNTAARNVSNTYQNVSLFNPDGGWQLMVDALYYTDDCPFEGYYGRGLDCRPCPEGGYCPGGYRMWPLAGWYTFSEYDGAVYPCVPASACLGGRASSCDVGYESDICAVCSLGYYRADAQRCALCSDGVTLAALLVVQMALVITLVSVLIILRTGALQWLLFFASAVRALYIVTKELAGLPTPVYNILSGLKLFAFDISFWSPECFGVRMASWLWLLNILPVAGFFVVLAIMLYVQYRMAVVGFRHRRRKRHEFEVMQAKAHYHSANVLFVFAMIACGMLVTRAFKMMNCVSVNGALRLVDQAEQCFTAQHAVSFVLSLVLVALAFVFVALPLWFSRKMTIGQRISAISRAMVSITSDEMSGKNATIWGSTLLLGDLVLAAVTAFTTGTALLVGQLVIVSSLLLFVVFIRPFNVWYKTLTVVFLQVATIMAVIHPAISTGVPANFIAWLIVVFMCITALFFALTVLLLKCCGAKHSSRVKDGVRQ
eukprot:TRINITY_DN4759_c0_g1_i2.p1 TRINITY_DN4759_c0_g1~~TRINITY_DN4759_c0_g1_i2.p1  ORF type:complete len:1246 (+),score=296.69 TRINITY_DN4759_c0_g1_i2:735-4472(+)